MKFSIIAEAYGKLEGLSRQARDHQVLAALLKETPKGELPMLVYLTQGKLRPTTRASSSGSRRIAIRALPRLRACPAEEVKRTYVESGASRERGREGARRGRQNHLVKEQLTLERVYKTLFDISQI